MNSSEYLIDFQAHDGVSVVTLRVSSCGYATAPTDTPANAVYASAIVDPGDFSASLFGSGQTFGAAEVGYGQIVLNNLDGALDAWLSYAFDGRPFVVRRIASPQAPFASAEIVMTGTVQSLDSTSAKSQIRVRVYDRRLVLDKPLQTNRYAGTTTSGGATAEGNEDLKDQVKPLTYGRVFNIPVAPANPFDLIYQVSDGPVSSIQVYDGGAPLDVGSDYASVAALRSATITPGTFATAKALGLFRLGWSPAFDVTADVVEGAAAANRRAGSIVRRILTKLGLSGADIDLASFAALDASAPYECGIFIDSDETAMSAISDVLASVGGTILPDALGIFHAGRLTAPGSPVLTITGDNIVSDGGSFGLAANPDTDGGVPAWRVIMRYRKVWHAAGQLAGCVDDDFRAFLAVEFREVKADNAAVKLRNLLAVEMTIDTCLAQLGDATAEAARRLALYGVDRYVIVVEVPAEEAAGAALGETISLVAPVGLLANGRNMVVIGRRERLALQRVVLTLWG